MIKTAFKTGVVVAALAGTALTAAPASAASHDHNHGNAVGNNVNVVIVGGYGVTCGSVSLASKSGAGCNGNHVKNAHTHGGAAGWSDYGW